jgi:phosphinothricin acetyltransferase
MAKFTSYAIEAMTPEDWPAVQEIYLDGISTGQATFETKAPTWEAWDTGHRPDCRLVLRIEGQVAGWAALSPVSRRQVYAGVAEVSIYLATAMQGQGLGKVLLQALVDESERAGVWTLQASIFPENEASIALHKASGFREVGYRERIAQRHGVWRNTVLMERRSRVVGD